MQVVAIQLDMVWQDKPANHAKIRQWVAQAAPPPGALIVLPEMCDTGFSMQLDATAQTAKRETEGLFRALAAETGCAVLGGVVGPIEGGTASNEAVAFDPEGTELVRYRKMQPFTPSGEDVKYPAGDDYGLFQWQGVRIAPFICYDLRFPEVFRPAALAGAELLVVMACWPSVRSEHWVRLLQARAIENQAYVLGVNRCGAEPNLQFDGRSAAFDPHGERLFEADAAEQVLQTEIQASTVREWRDAFPALRDIRRDLVATPSRETAS